MMVDAYGCLAAAGEFCIATEIINECPQALDMMSSKTLPFSSVANTADLGAVQYDPTTVADTNCLEAGDCYQRLQSLAPIAKAGVMGNFTVWLSAQLIRGL